MTENDVPFFQIKYKHSKWPDDIWEPDRYDMRCDEFLTTIGAVRGYQTLEKATDAIAALRLLHLGRGYHFKIVEYRIIQTDVAE